MSGRSLWKDGEHVRVVEVTALGGDRYRVTVDDAELTLTANALADGDLRIATDRGVLRADVTRVGDRRFVNLDGMDFVFERATEGVRRGADVDGGLEAPMPGVVTRVLVATGDMVVKGQPLLALEAMKMEHVIRAPRDGRVRLVGAKAGELVTGGARLVELEEA